MKRRIAVFVCLLGLLMTTAGCRFSMGTSSSPSSEETSSDAAPDVSGSSGLPDGEMRGVWLSFGELSRLIQGKSVEDAKSALDAMMDRVKSLKLNTIIFHVRANSDAYYKSSVFNPAASVANLLNEGFDPLAYAVDAAHSRGLKLQAWVNPYRIGDKKENAKSNDIFSVNGTYYYDPASLDVQSLIMKGVAEIVDNYAVDGIQFDDYFYPSDTSAIPPSSPASFESGAYTAYQSGGGTLSVADWRRANVDALIAGTCLKVHARKGCVFGVSPRASVSQSFSQLYADVEQWMLVPGYVDYICPQIYYGFENTASPFDQSLAAWAVMKRDPSVKLYIGLGLYKTGWYEDSYAGDGKAEWSKHDDIMQRSVQLIRAQKACGGMMFYNYSGFDETIREKGYDKDVAKREIDHLLSVLN